MRRKSGIASLMRQSSETACAQGRHDENYSSRVFDNMAEGFIGRGFTGPSNLAGQGVR